LKHGPFAVGGFSSESIRTIGTLRHAQFLHHVSRSLTGRIFDEHDYKPSDKFITYLNLEKTPLSDAESKM
jgi:hypothetical protein